MGNLKKDLVEGFSVVAKQIFLAMVTMLGAGIFWMSVLLKDDARFLKEKLENRESYIVEPAPLSVVAYLDFDIPVYCSYPLVSILYTSATKWQALIISVASFIGYMARLIVHNTPWQPLGITFSPFFMGISLFFLFPKTGVLANFVPLYAAGIISILMFMIARSMPSDSDMEQLVLVVLVFPVMREFSAALTRRACKKLYCNHDENSRFRLHEYGWFYFVMQQCLVALQNRLLFTVFEKEWMLIGVLVYQSCLEIFLRLTLLQRDNFSERMNDYVWNHLFSCCQTGASQNRKNIMPSSNIIPSPELEARKVPTAEEYEERRIGFLTKWLITDGICEWYAVLLTPILILGLQDYKLLIPLDVYSEQEVLENGLQVSKVLESTMLQIAIELVVDLLCLLLEKRFLHLPIEKEFNKLKTIKWTFALTLIGCAWASSPFAMSYIVFKDNVEACVGQNICECDYLHPTGLRREFCLMLNRTGNITD